MAAHRSPGDHRRGGDRDLPDVPPAVRLLARLGGGEERATRPPGKIVLTRGLRRLLDVFATEAILADEVRQHGGLPPRIAALLGRAVTG